MAIPTGGAAGSGFAAWLQQHKKWLSILGAAIAITAYVSKEILRTRMEGAIQRLEHWQEESRIGERLDRIEPNLRDELSRGTDSKKRFADQAATLFLKEGEYSPGWGKPAVPFYVLVDVECDTDDSCRVAEWYRYRSTLEYELAQNERFLDVVGPPSLFDLERTSLAAIENRLTQAKNQEEQAFLKLTQKGADGNLVPLNHAAVEDFASAVNHVETATKEQNFELSMYAPCLVSRLYRNLRIASILGGVLFLAGWSLSLLGHIYGLEGVKPPE